VSGCATANVSPEASGSGPNTSPNAASAPGSPQPGEPATSPSIASALPLGLILHGPRTRKWVALTFDADMTPDMLAELRDGTVASWFDARILAILQSTRPPATVFLTGLWARTYPDVVRKLAADPRFDLANHSFDHSAFEGPCYGLPIVAGGDAAKRAEVEQAAQAIEQIDGIAPRWFRFPGGCLSASDVGLVHSLGETPVQWDVVSGDAFQPDQTVVIRDVLSRVRPGSIVAMHFIGAPNAPATATALLTIIPTLRARGFSFVTLDTLLRSGLLPG